MMHENDETVKLAYPSEVVLLEDVEKRAFQFEKTYHGCAQCALGALMECFPMLRDPNGFKAATGLGGGVGLSIEGSCGGLTGGVMVLSLFFGRTLENLADHEGLRFRSYRIANRLHERFVAEYGTSLCRGIHQHVMGRAYRLNHPDEWDQFLEAGGHSDKCPTVVGRAARWTAELLIEEAEASGRTFQFCETS
jgi:C_GCAxxG_C_C family probable redox protein